MITINNYEIKQDKFPDGTLLMKAITHDISIRGVLHFNWVYESDAELFTLICARRHYSHFDATLKMRYLPHARMDRVKNPEDVFTLKYFCEVINSLNFNEVTVWDAHSAVSLGLLNNVYNYMPRHNILTAMNTISEKHNDSLITLFYPDEGAMKRYSDLIKCPYAFGIKKRNWETGKIEGYDIVNTEVFAENPILIVDDICSYGGTFYHAVNAIRKYTNAPIYLYVTHLEANVLQGELWGTRSVEAIFTANPLDQNLPMYDKIIKVD